MATVLSDRSGNPPAPEVPTDEIDGVGLGGLLRRARERRGLTLQQISNETRIPRRYLEALESDNLAALPPGFYRRAQIRTYARVVNLDQNLALAQLERALEQPAARHAVPGSARTHEPTLSRNRLLVVAAVVVTALVFGRAMGGLEPARDGDAPVRIDTDLPARTAVPETPPNDPVAAALPAPSDQVAGPPPPVQVPPPSAPPETAPAILTTPSVDRPASASDGELAAVEKPADVREPANAVTELVVTTEPVGARVTVNGVGWGVAPVTIRHLPPGDRRIRVSKEGYAAEERVVRLAEGKRLTIDIQLRSAP